MINQCLSAAASLLSKVPQPLVQPAIDVATTLLKSLVAGDTAAETMAKTRAELVKLETIQAAYDARAQRKFPGFRP